MVSEQIKQMMLKFLERNYPISRVKYNKRFKRGIVLDGGEVFIFNDTVSYLTLQHRMIDILCTVFNCDEPTSFNILKIFLKIK